MSGAFSPFLQGFDVKQDWDVYKAGGGFYLGDWKISADYNQIDRDGTKLIGALMGTSPGGRSMILPFQINDTQQQVDVKADWTGTQGQLNLSYWYSKYNNDANSLVWQNPYANRHCRRRAVRRGRRLPHGLWPDGADAEQRLLAGPGDRGLELHARMRLTGTVSYSVMSQNDPFLPYTINTAAQTPGTSLLVPVGLPRTSLNGEIKNTLVDLNVLDAPGLEAVAEAELPLHGPQQQHAVEPVRVRPWATRTTSRRPINNANTSAQIVTNLPTSTTENRFKVDADYQIFQRTMLRGWYQYTNVSYSPSNWEFRSNTQNNLLGVELRRIMSESFTGALRYVWDQRTGSTFASQNAYYAAYTARAGSRARPTSTTCRRCASSFSRTTTRTRSSRPGRSPRSSGSRSA